MAGLAATSAISGSVPGMRNIVPSARASSTSINCAEVSLSVFANAVSEALGSDSRGRWQARAEFPSKDFQHISLSVSTLLGPQFLLDSALDEARLRQQAMKRRSGPKHFGIRLGMACRKDVNSGNSGLSHRVREAERTFETSRKAGFQIQSEYATNAWRARVLMRV